MRRYTPAILVGLALGLSLGLAYTWLIDPVKYVDTAPASLRADFKAEYVQLVARSYVMDRDLDRARARLARLEESDSARVVTALAQQVAASGGDAETLASMATLAAALGAGPASPTPVAAAPTFTPVPTRVPALTPRPLPTRVPTPTPVGAFEPVNQELICDVRLDEPLIQVLAYDANGGQVPGVEVIVEWADGFDHFFTGLKPQLGDGYGDFTMTEGEVYAVHLADSPSAAVTGVLAEKCPDGALGSWRLEFRQR